MTAEDATRKSNCLPKPTIGLVLGGGGFKGAYQIGVWKALKPKLMEMGITAVNFLAGTSVGAINAVLIANDDLGTAQRVWLEKDIVALAPRRLASYILGYGMLFGPLLAAFLLFVFTFLEPSHAVILEQFSFSLGITAWITFFLLLDASFDDRIFFTIDIDGIKLLGFLATVVLSLILLRANSSILVARTTPLSPTRTAVTVAIILIVGTGLGIISGKFGIRSLKTALKSQIFSNENLISELEALLDLDQLRRSGTSIFVTTATSRTFLDPFIFNYDQPGTGPLRTGQRSLNTENPRVTDKWVAEYFDLSTAPDKTQALDHLRLSAALPIAFQLGSSPLGARTVDGGLADNIPILPLLYTPADWIIIVALKPQPFTYDSLRSWITSKWFDQHVPNLSEQDAVKIYRSTVRFKSINYKDWFPKSPQLAGKRFTVIAPQHPLAAFRRLPFLTGTLNLFRAAREAWFAQGFEDANRIFPSVTFEYPAENENKQQQTSAQAVSN